MKILILGSSGLLGKNIYHYLKKKYFIIHNGINKRKRDLNDLKNLKFLLLKKPDLIINCLGETNIEYCEKNKKKANKINILISKNIFKIKKKYDLNFDFLQFSTDQFYNNKNYKKNSEKILPKIMNFYSLTKLNCEKIVLKNNGMIIRTNFFGKSLSSKKSITDWLYSSFKSKKNFYLFNDIYFSPLSLSTLSKIIQLILNKGVKTGIFNLGSKSGMSKYKFGINFAKFCRIYNKNYEVIKSTNLLKVKRSKYMIMNSKKFEKVYKIKLPKLFQEIKKESKNYIKNA